MNFTNIAEGKRPIARVQGEILGGVGPTGTRQTPFLTGVGAPGWNEVPRHQPPHCGKDYAESPLTMLVMGAKTV